MTLLGMLLVHDAIEFKIYIYIFLMLKIDLDL